MPEHNGANLSLGSLTNLSGKIAVVTGGGTGIGLMIAKGFACNGAKVYITGRRIDVLSKAPEVYTGSIGSIVPLKMDVTDKQSILKAVEHVRKNDGKLDILVNNAGTVGPETPFVFDDLAPERSSIATYGQALFDSQTFDQWGVVATTDVASLFFVTTAFLGLLEESTKDGSGTMASVINISSASAHTKISHGIFAYVSMKAAASHLTQLLAVDFALKNIPIRVNGIAPGLFPSELTDTEERLEEQTKTTMSSLRVHPLERAGREYEMVGLAVYLASPSSGYTHGQEIIIDGGYSRVNP